MTAKRNIAIALSSVIVILTGLSCSRTEVESTGIAGRDIPISFSAGVEETKSLFTPENFSRAGHKIAVFDVFDGEQLYMGSIDGQGKGTPVIYTSSPETSPYWSTDGNYFWTPSGTHNFFAYSTYYAKDPDNGADKPASLPEDKVSFLTEQEDSMKISDWNLSIENQFDFLYATHSRNMSETDPYRPVELQFKHLFAAVGVSFRNISSISYTVTDWYFQGISDKGMVVIPFKAGEPDITLHEPDQNAHLYDDVDPEGVIRSKSLDSEGGVYYPYKAEGTGENSTGASEYVLVWPHSYEELSDAVFHFVYYSGDQEGEGTAEDLDKQPGKQEITLKLGGEACDFIVNEWKPGTRYMYNITISDNKIYFEVRIVPWINDDVILD